MALLLEALGVVALVTRALVLVAGLGFVVCAALDRLTQRWGPRVRWQARRRRREVLDAAEDAVRSGR